MELWNREKQIRLQEYPKLDYEYEKSVILDRTQETKRGGNYDSDFKNASSGIRNILQDKKKRKL